MYRFVIVQPHSFTYITGNLFYLEELAQCLKENYCCNVVVYNISNRDRKELYNRYYTIIEETKKIQENDILITDVVGLHSLLIQDSNILNKIFYCLITASTTTYTKIKSIITKYFKYFIYNKEKFYLLVEPGYKTGLENFFLFKNKIIYYTRGFYFNNYITNNVSNTSWYLYTVLHEGVEQNISKEHIDDICLKQKITYTTNTLSYNPALEYSGLIYVRKKDYMPRLPYEFWYYNKPVIFLDISTGLKQRIDNLPLHIPIIRKESIPKCSLDNIVSLVYGV